MTAPSTNRDSNPPEAPQPRSRERRLLVEVLLVALGVALGLGGESWRQAREHRQLAAETLRRVRAELVDNRAAVDAVEGRHVQDLQAIQQYFKADAAERQRLAFPFSGTHPAFLQHAAWDVAVATQSIQFLNRDLVTSIARVYAIQRQLDDATRDITQVMYAKAGDSDIRRSLAPFAVYFGDCTVIERRLKHELETVIEQINRDLGSTPTDKDQRSARP